MSELFKDCFTSLHPDHSSNLLKPHHAIPRFSMSDSTPPTRLSTLRSRRSCRSFKPRLQLAWQLWPQQRLRNLSLISRLSTMLSATTFYVNLISCSSSASVEPKNLVSETTLLCIRVTFVSKLATRFHQGKELMWYALIVEGHSV